LEKIVFDKTIIAVTIAVALGCMSVAANGLLLTTGVVSPAADTY